MDVRTAEAGKLAADVLVVPVAEGGRTPTGLDAMLAARVQEILDAGELPSEPGEAMLLHLENGGVRRIALATLGRNVDADAVRTAVSAAVREARRVGGTVAVLVDGSLPVGVEEQARAAVDGIVLGGYDPRRWTSEGQSDSKPFDAIVLAGVNGAAAESAARAARVAAWANRARDLSNSPPNELTPEKLAERAAELAKQAGDVKVEALGRDEIERLGMGAFAGVAQGAHNEPRLIVMHYAPAGAAAGVKLGLVGKAITFDTGGISLKPALHMENMKGDMSGGAAVIAGLCAIADLGTPLNAVAVVAATENMPGGGAYRPGDILHAANGKTIEVTNTDAEGRLVLADALWYAREQGATHVADFATLTGAMVAALGDLYAGLFANDDAWAERILEASASTGDLVWRMPLHPRYRRYVNSLYADMKNSSDLREGGPALAAEFLQEFAGEGPWAHLDIAGPAFLDRSRGDYLWQAGGTGFGVRLIAELARSLAA